MTKKIVVALGGNAILQPGQKGTAEQQLANIKRTCGQIAEMIAQGHQVVVTHGNGPQVGSILIQNEAGKESVPAMPLDVCGAESQGLIGYMMQQTLREALRERGIDKPVATVITQAVVDKNDPAFKKPTKPVGPFYDEAHARREMETTGDTWIEDAGRGWRKVVPSPDPLHIIERESIAVLIDAGQIVIANGGGGIPVVEENGSLRGVEAVIDKDLGGERLAKDVGADIFMILTDVPGAAVDHNTENERFLGEVTLEEIKAYREEGHFKAGSMGPKVLACIRFIEAGGELAIIASLKDALEALEGEAGTRISRQE